MIVGRQELAGVTPDVNLTEYVRVYPHRVSATASPLESIVTLGNQFLSITMYSNCDADASAATDSRCGQTLTSTPLPSVKKAANSGFQTQRRRQQNIKQGYQWPRKKDSCSPKILQKTTKQ